MTKPFSEFGVQSSPLNFGLTGPFGLSAAYHKSVATLKLSMNQLTTLRWSLADAVWQVKQTGYDAIGLWRPKLLELGEAETLNILQRARLSVSSLSFAGGFTGNCGFSYVDAIADCRQAIEQARTLGARTVIVVGGSRNGHTDRHSRRLVVDAMKELGEVAAAADVGLSLLPMQRFYSKRWTFLNSLDQSLDLISSIDNRYVKLGFDTYHLWQEPRLIERIREITPLTGIVQLGDADGPATSERDRLLPGQGKIRLADIVQAFQLAGYSGYFDVQAWSSNVWAGNYSHLIEQTHSTVKAMSLRAVANT